MTARNLTPPTGFAVVPGLTGDAVAHSGRDQHALDLAHVFRPAGEAMPDALVAEMRRHIGGMTATIEAQMLLVLTENDNLSGGVSTIEGGFCEAALLQSPHLISPALFKHFRSRAAFALIARQDHTLSGSMVADPGADLGWLLDDHDAQVADMATGLLLAENRWSDLTAGDGKMQADLPADFHAELCWVVGASLSRAIERNTLSPASSVQNVIVDAIYKMLNRYDEERGPVVRAALLARVLLARANASTDILRALEHRRYLLLAAFAAERLSVPVDRLMPLLVQGSVDYLLAIFRVLDCDGAALTTAVKDLKVARGDLAQCDMNTLVQSYQNMDEAQARSLLGELGLPQEFAAKCALLASCPG